ncbi:hypothetical protein PAAG_00350 [Paracoccidioides lutzii Pb01]|uniref:Uncharacterized protein n=1 Tax=Paracoccidioides lutzii (strain ATCC MYA-826 / Pb01) TaxID=502779 RepID=C1GPA5_PARBA|nr:hypothetical protein PAAG_00350 [Paracoccidioides lutzii Pb01]EEH36027.2 hypothetical protein PAAG_00350 [Paracoccidioides lutzii Pb01]
MESTPEVAQQRQGCPAQDLTLEVDFSWKRYKSLITEKDNPQSPPLYIVDYRATKPHLAFRAGEDQPPFATGSLRTVSINADCQIRGRTITLKALKRFRTEYTHLSYAFAKGSINSAAPEPVPMTWTSSSGFKTWDFICLDEKQMPLAKFSANAWSLKKVGNITLIGSNIAAATGSDTISDAVREEIVVTGLTLFYCMVLRSTSILSFFGAIFSRPGHDEREKEREKDGSIAAPAAEQ